MTISFLLAAQLASFSVPTAFVTTVTNTPVAVAFHPEANLENAAYRWVAADNSNGTVVSWPDRIQGLQWKNDQSAARPTATASYVAFDNTHWLTSSPPTLSSNCAVGFVLNMIEPTAGGGSHPGIWLGPGGASCTTNYLGLGLPDNGGLNYSVQDSPGCNFTPTYLGAKYGSLTNVIHTLVWWVGETNVSAGFKSSFTNGTATASASFSGSSQTLTRGVPVALGRNIFRETGPTMRIYEMWVWTNAYTATPSTSAIVSNFHYYASRMYAF